MAVSYSCFVVFVAVFHLHNAAVTIIDPPPAGATTQKWPTNVIPYKYQNLGKVWCFLHTRIAGHQLENNDIRNLKYIISP